MIKDIKFEFYILNKLITDDRYARMVLPFLKKNYFLVDFNVHLIFSIIKSYSERYSNTPSFETILLCLEDDTFLKENKILIIDEKQITDIKTLLEEIYNLEVKLDEEYLIQKSEKFCYDKAVYNALIECIDIAENGKKETKDNIVDVMLQALSVTFDTSVGHDYNEDAEQRFNLYKNKEKKYPTDIDELNLITDGGFEEKTLNIFMAKTGVGKSITLCHLASHYLRQGFNVLYITLEMSENKIAERIDENIFNVTKNELHAFNVDDYKSRFNIIKQKLKSKLFIKEYPTSLGNVNHFESLLKELKIKKNFKPEIIIVDYLNICASRRPAVGLYSNGKQVAEELRGFAVEHKVPLFTATQTKRGNSSDYELEDTGESYAIPQTADFYVAFIDNEEFRENNQIMVKQLKNRYNDDYLHRKFLVGIDRSKSRLFNIDNENDKDINSFTMPKNNKNYKQLLQEEG